MLLGLVEFVVTQVENEENTEENRQWVQSVMQHAISSDKHFGDCTKDINTCLLCLLEYWLDEYYKYTKKELDGNHS